MTDEHQQIHNNENLAIFYWRRALELRLRENIPKDILPPHASFNNVKEFETHEELNNISMDLDDMRMTALVISGECNIISSIKLRFNDY